MSQQPPPPPHAPAPPHPQAPPPPGGQPPYGQQPQYAGYQVQTYGTSTGKGFKGRMNGLGIGGIVLGLMLVLYIFGYYSKGYMMGPQQALDPQTGMLTMSTDQVRMFQSDFLAMIYKPMGALESAMTGTTVTVSGPSEYTQGIMAQQQQQMQQMTNQSNQQMQQLMQQQQMEMQQMQQMFPGMQWPQQMQQYPGQQQFPGQYPGQGQFPGQQPNQYNPGAQQNPGGVPFQVGPSGAYRKDGQKAADGEATDEAVKPADPVIEDDGAE